MEYKNNNKLVNVTRRKQTHICREETSDYQWEERSGEGHNRGRGLRDAKHYM